MLRQLHVPRAEQRSERGGQVAGAGGSRQVGPHHRRRERGRQGRGAAEHGGRPVLPLVAPRLPKYCDEISRIPWTRSSSC